MRVLLVNPPIPHKFRMIRYADKKGKEAMSLRVMVGPPLALNEIAGVIPDEEILILDQKTESDNNPQYDCIEGLIDTINEFRPDIVSFTCITAQYNSVKKMLKYVKKVDKNIFTTVGGIHPTLCTGDFIDSSVDLITVGLGKASYRDIIKELKVNGRDNADFSHIPGLAFTDGASLKYTKLLCKLSYKEIKENYVLDNIMPNRELTDKYNYIIPHENKRIQYISTSQGCTHKCNFCSIWPITDGRYFHKDVELIINEIKHMERYEIIRFCDANTFGDLKQAKLLFNRIIEEGLDNHEYIVDVRTDFVIEHPKIMELAYKAGVRVAICGLESIDDEELRRYKKNNTVKNTKEALKILNEMGIKVNGNYIISPEHDADYFEKLAYFVDENPIFHSGFTILTPFPGTEQWEMYKDRITINNFDYYNLTNAVFETVLPEREFYSRISELYKIAAKSRAKYLMINNKKNSVDSNTV
ncbi:MAG TPA: radical SAM protein [Tissierellales bacterium]|nr:radical SAM protein [Tissierellales bacterium]